MKRLVMQSKPEGGDNMMKRLNRIVRRIKGRSGQSLVEYALMVGLVAVAAVAVVPQMATQINTIFNKVTSVLTSAAG